MCLYPPPLPLPYPVSDGDFYGTPKSFLFSITNDCKIPYHGRVKGPRQASDDEKERDFKERQRWELSRCVGLF